jgi:carbamoyl-phosphate synthase small subunit
MRYMCIGMQGGTMKALVALEDGTVFEGRSFGAEGEKEGEIVFNTSMTGYQEIMTDPSYKGQIVTMTYPLIGNYGVNDEDVESKGPKVEGFIAREFSRITSNYRATGDLLSYFKKHNIIAIEEIDTRALTKHLRVRGAMKGIISTKDLDPESLVKKARQWQGIVGVDLVKEVTCSEAYEYNVGRRTWDVGREKMGDGRGEIEAGSGNRQEITSNLEPSATAPEDRLRTSNSTLRVVVMDFGVKMNILRMLKSVGCDVTVVPAWEKAETILAMKPDGVLLSNGPGDPEGVPYAITEIRKLFGKLPIFGICLGQQLLGLAYGGKTYKLKFGHRGANQPIQEIATGKVSITSENHGFAVDVESIKEHPVRITHINLNDKTIEGIEHTELPIFSVQYHPEASPGPHDSYVLFDKFKNMMNANREKR